VFFLINLCYASELLIDAIVHVHFDRKRTSITVRMRNEDMASLLFALSEAIGESSYKTAKSALGKDMHAFVSRDYPNLMSGAMDYANKIRGCIRKHLPKLRVIIDSNRMCLKVIDNIHSGNLSYFVLPVEYKKLLCLLKLESKLILPTANKKHMTLDSMVTPAVSAWKPTLTGLHTFEEYHALLTQGGMAAHNERLSALQ